MKTESIVSCLFLGDFFSLPYFFSTCPVQPLVILNQILQTKQIVDQKSQLQPLSMIVYNIICTFWPKHITMNETHYSVCAVNIFMESFDIYVAGWLLVWWCTKQNGCLLQTMLNELW